MKDKRYLAREITKFCFLNGIFDDEKNTYSEMIDAVEINLEKDDFVETTSKLINENIQNNNKYIRRNKKLKKLEKELDSYKEKMNRNN